MPLLFSLVFGEGVINDATSVVLLGAVSRVFPPAAELGDDDEPQPNQGLGVVLSFLYVPGARAHAARPAFGGEFSHARGSGAGHLPHAHSLGLRTLSTPGACT
jgi:hypothetical protein